MRDKKVANAWHPTSLRIVHFVVAADSTTLEHVLNHFGQRKRLIGFTLSE